MRFIFSIIKNIIAVIAILIIIYIALKYAPFLRDQEWNPISNPPNQTERNMDNPVNNAKQPQHGKRYSLEDNDIIKNVPTSQIKNVFNMIDKKEFMSVSGIGRMGYNDEYLTGQRGDEFIIYKFGSDSIRVYNNEFEMQQDLHKLGQNIELKNNQAY
ncbi:hypothetical protein UF70_1219 [Staphylococcus pasteuri]|uniref:DUF4930 family protein n=1 Tax=Staphylococcus pasteuri TaxID=45972 RepID=UPI000623F900|nr:DUF4930 family protein [Staphylococcus pasteuri]KKI57576.1 hypothetical protein UF70_1219 [Staphylococcus pasteuri]